MGLLAGRVERGGEQLSRIYAFDLFAANWDRHPGNYLVLEDGNALVVFAIDFSHVTCHPGLTPPQADPMSAPCATRIHFPQVVAPYGSNAVAALEIIDRLQSLPNDAISAILNEIPDDWLSPSDKSDVQSWWQGPLRSERTTAIQQGIHNGTLI